MSRSRSRLGRVPQGVALVALISAGVIARVATGAEPPSRDVHGSSLGGMACADAEQCVAVGTAGSVYGVQVPYAVASAGGGWSVEPPRPPAQVGDSALASVACPAAGPCVAVGRQALPTSFFGSRSGGDRPLAEAWDGNTWRTLTAPVPRDAVDAGFDGVGCSGTGCLAVGSYQTRAGKDRALAATFDGTTWRPSRPPTPRHSDALALTGVACPASGSCVVVGHYTSEILFSGVLPLILRWNGARWQSERAAGPPGSTDTELAAVDCPRSDRCVAVGFQRHPDGRYGTLAETWDGTSWTIVPTPDPAGSPDTELADVACPAPDRCLAVGSTVANAAVATFAESWDGARWMIEPTPVPAGSTASVLTTVACTGTDACRGAGIAWHDSPIGEGLTADHAAAGWTVEPVPADPANG